MKLHYSTVVENNDLTMKGRVKIKVEHLHDTMSDDMLPWANQFNLSMGGMTLADVATPYGSSKIPKVGSLVWVFFLEEDISKKCFYVSDVTLETFNITKNAFVLAAQIIMNAWLASPSGLTPSSPSTYMNLHYTLYPNGIIIGIDIVSKEMFVYHSPTTFVSINNSGAINVAGTDVVIGGSNSATITSLSGNSITVDSTTMTVSNVGGTGSMTIDALGNIEVSGLSVTINGLTNLVTPTGSGGFCALPACLFTGAPHIGNKVS